MPVGEELRWNQTLGKRRMLKALIRGAAFGAALAASTLVAQAQTELDFASWQLEEPGNSDWWKAAIKAFEAENPDIRIKQNYIPFADYLTQLTIRFASNRPPAVIQISEQNYGAYASQGWLAPLDERIQGTDIATDWASAQADLKWDGETRGVLISNSALMLFYNEDLLQKAGVAAPKSWEEFKTAVAKLTDKQAGTFGLSAVTTEHPTAVEDLHRYAMWAGTSLVKDGKYNLTAPEVVAALDAYRQTVGQNAPLGNNSAVARQLFVDGRTAFLIDGPWVWSWLEKATPEMRPKLKMVRTPFEPQEAPGGITIHIAEGLDQGTADAAWKFVQFVTRPEWQRAYLKQTGQPAGRKSPVLTSDDIAAAPQLEIISAAAMASEPLFPTDQRIRGNFAEYSAILMTAALKLLSTQEPTEAVLKVAQDQLQAAIPLD